jgi:hypothetical protein
MPDTTWEKEDSGSHQKNHIKNSCSENFCTGKDKKMIIKIPGL